MRRGSTGRRGWLTSWQILVAFAVLAGGSGLIGLRFMRQEIQTRAVDRAAAEARIISSAIVGRYVTADLLHSGTLDARHQADMNADVVDLVGRHELDGLAVWAIGDGHLIFGDRRHPAAETTLPDGERERSRRGAFNVADATGHDGPTLEVFLPFDADRDHLPDAVVEVQLPSDPINDAITQSTRLLYGGAALVALFGTVVLLRVRRRHRREEHDTVHDSLTGLGNRVLLANRAGEILVRGGGTALLLFDLDGFKEINDTLGHLAGDDLLVSVARRLRTADTSGATVVRLGGDEFAVLLADLAGPSGAAATAQRLRRALREPMSVGGVTVETEASVGIALGPAHGTDISTLLRCAEVAMYHAKHNGLGVTTYDPATDTRDAHQLTLLAELRHAITDGQLRLFYQPKSRPDGTIEQVEALVRWQHPDRGLLAPFAFIPLAERTSLIKPLTAWVIGEATRQCASWRADGQPLGVAVNISARNLADPELPTIVLDAIAAAGIPATALELEVTETAVTTDPERAYATLNRLRTIGIGVSIDDFGVGYTSLSQLGTLPANTLKIDRIFVADLLVNPVHEAVVRNVVQLARDLGLTTVAEGVESHDIWARLNEFGCDEIQGYVLTPPLAPDRLATWLADWRFSAHLIAASHDEQQRRWRYERERTGASRSAP